MALTVYLAKLVGLVLVVIGLAILVRRQFFVAVFAEYVDQRLVRTSMSMIEMLAGIALVVAHHAWSPLPAAVLTMIGWMAVLEGAFFLLLPDGWLARFMATFGTPGWYAIGGLLALVAGIYLAGFGFAWW